MVHRERRGRRNQVVGDAARRRSSAGRDALGVPQIMKEPTAAALRLRVAFELHRSHVDELLDRYGATNPRLFGSVARGDAREDSDLDLLVDLSPDAGNELMRVSGLGEELGESLGVRVDVVAAPLQRDQVSATALEDAVPV